MDYGMSTLAGVRHPSCGKPLPAEPREPAVGNGPRRRDGLRPFPIDDEAVVYDVAHDSVHYLNRTAWFIWEKCDGTREPAEIAAEMAQAFDGLNGDDARASVLADVRQTVASLRDDGLIDWIER